MNALRMVRTVIAFFLISFVSVHASTEVTRTGHKVKDPLANVKRATVALGWWASSESQADETSSIRVDCSGFLYQYAPRAFWTRVWVVTAAHCIQGKTQIVVRTNSKSGTTIFFEIPADQWFIHPSQTATDLVGRVPHVALAHAVATGLSRLYSRP